MRHMNMTARSARGNPSPKSARAAKGLTQRQLAALVPCTQCTVFRIEKQGRYPRTKSIRAAYLAALGLTEKAAS